jgi:hypothetical protein
VHRGAEATIQDLTMTDDIHLSKMLSRWGSTEVDAVPAAER